jgi:hypothetical protein
MAVVILGASIVAQQQAAPAPAAPIPAGLPDWAYTPPPPAGSPPPPSALPADDSAVVSIPGTTKPIVTSMSVQDMTAVSAFAASTPAAARQTATTAAR